MLWLQYKIIISIVLLLPAVPLDFDYYCGTTWDDASTKCFPSCPSGKDDECPAGESCQILTGCAAIDERPLFLGLDTRRPSLPGVSSHGVIVGIVTSSDAVAFSILFLELYTVPARTEVSYTVSLKRGEWGESEESRKDFEPIIRGNAFTVNGKLPLPLGDYGIRLDGNETSYSLYVGVSEAILIDRPPSRKGIDGDGVVLQTAELTVYEGASVMIYPLSRADHPVYYLNPRGFAGRMWYARDACFPFSSTSWDDCSRVNILPEWEATNDAIYYIGEDVSLSPSSVGGTKDDVVKIFLIITFGNASKGVFELINDAARTSLQHVMLEYCSNQLTLSQNEIRVTDVQVWYQQFILSGGRNEPRSDEEKKQQNNTSARYQITLLLYFRSTLPHTINRDILQIVINEDAPSLLLLLNSTPELTMPLRNMGNISSVIATDQFTPPPYPSPSQSPTFLPLISSTVLAKTTSSSPSSPPWVVFASALWICSILFSTWYLRRVRRDMIYERSSLALNAGTPIENDWAEDKILIPLGLAPVTMTGHRGEGDYPRECGGGDESSEDTESGAEYSGDDDSEEDESGEDDSEDEESGVDFSRDISIT